MTYSKQQLDEARQMREQLEPVLNETEGWDAVPQEAIDQFVGGVPVANINVGGNAFCPTGPGGGVDSSCSGGDSGGAGGPVSSFPVERVKPESIFRTGFENRVQKEIERLEKHAEKNDLAGDMIGRSYRDAAKNLLEKLKEDQSWSGKPGDTKFIDPAKFKAYVKSGKLRKDLFEEAAKVHPDLHGAVVRSSMSAEKAQHGVWGSVKSLFGLNQATLNYLEANWHGDGIVINFEFDPGLHPRGPDGRYIDKADVPTYKQLHTLGTSGQTDPAKIAESISHMDSQALTDLASQFGLAPTDMNDAKAKWAKVIENFNKGRTAAQAKTVDVDPATLGTKPVAKPAAKPTKPAPPQDLPYDPSTGSWYKPGQRNPGRYELWADIKWQAQLQWMEKNPEPKKVWGKKPKKFDDEGRPLPENQKELVKWDKKFGVFIETWDKGHPYENDPTDPQQEKFIPKEQTDKTFSWQK